MLFQRNDKGFTTADDSNVKCHLCHQKGHKKRDCPNVSATRDSKTKSKLDINNFNSRTPSKREHSEGKETTRTFVSDFEKTPTQAKSDNLLKTAVKSPSPEKFWNGNQSHEPIIGFLSPLGYPLQPSRTDIQQINMLFPQHGDHQFQHDGHQLQHGGHQLQQLFLFNQHPQLSPMQKPVLPSNTQYQHSNVPNIHFDEFQEQQSLQTKIEEERRLQNDAYPVKSTALSKNLPAQHVIQYNQITDAQQLYRNFPTVGHDNQITDAQQLCRDFPPVGHEGQKLSKKGHIQPVVQSSRNKDHGKQKQSFNNHQGPAQQNSQSSEHAGRLQNNSPKYCNGNKQRNKQNQQESVRQRHNSQGYQDPSRQRNDSENYQETNHHRQKSVNCQNNPDTQLSSRQETMDSSNSFVSTLYVIITSTFKLFLTFFKGFLIFAGTNGRKWFKVNTIHQANNCSK